MARLIKASRLPALSGVLLALASGPAAAETYTVAITDMNLGVVTSGVTGDTLYRIDPSTGVVTRVSGTGTRVGGASANSVVTISCAAVAVGDCTKAVNVKIAVAGSPTKRARALTRILDVMGTATLNGSPIGGPVGGFQINPIGPNASKTFFVGADLGIAGDNTGLPTGDAESDFSVFVAPAPLSPTSGAIGRATVRVLRSILMTKNSDLVFGRIALPSAGAGTVTIDPVTGVRTVTGGTPLGATAPSRANFTVSGEGGQTFSVTVPATFQLTGPTPPLTVTTTNSAGPTPTLSAALGAQGTFDLGVGGSFPIDATTTVGDYSGSFIVTVAYN